VQKAPQTAPGSAKSVQERWRSFMLID